MKELYTVIAFIIFGYALRSCKTIALRKLGALVMLAASGLCFYYLFESVLAGILAMAAWFFLPWIELLTRIRNQRMPLINKLKKRSSANLNAFPNAHQYVTTLENSGFEHISNCGWNLGGVDQLYQLYWNAEKKSVASLCLCEQASATFSYITITSKDIANGVWRTTNFPFSPTLKPSPSVHWNQISCVNECVVKLLQQHGNFLHKQGFVDDDLSIPDPDHLEQELEHELQHQIDHNLEQGIITPACEDQFRYTIRGLFYLWRQFIRDMIRLC